MRFVAIEGSDNRNPCKVDAAGNLQVSTQHPVGVRFNSNNTSLDATANVLILSADADKDMHIHHLSLSASGATWAELRDQYTTRYAGPYFLQANTSVVLAYPPESPLVVDKAHDLRVKTSAAVGITVDVTGRMELPADI